MLGDVVMTPSCFGLMLLEVVAELSAVGALDELRVDSDNPVPSNAICFFLCGGADLLLDESS